MLLYVYFFLLVSAVVGIVIYIVKSQVCPKDKVIADFYSGRIKENKRKVFISHLGTCEKCQERLHNFKPGRKIEDHLIDKK